MAAFIREQIHGDGVAFGPFISAYREFVTEVVASNPQWRLLGFDTDLEDTKMPRLRFGYQPTGKMDKCGWLLFRRGLVHEVHLHCAEFLRIAPWLFSVQPVCRVRLLDRRPSQERLGRGDLCGFTWTTDVGWHKSEEYGAIAECLPRSLFVLVQTAFENRRHAWDEREAIHALSLACVQYGREVSKGEWRES